MPEVPNSEIVRKIYQLESSSGLYDKCIRKGKGFNGLGWGQSLTKDNCYPNRKLVMDKVDNWITARKSEGLTTAQILCTYNLGKPNGKVLNDCDYYQNYLTIN